MDPLEAEICRLCFSNDNILYHLHHDLEADVRDILSKHFGEVNDLNILPKFVCNICHIRITSFHAFYCTVQEAQQTFVRRMIDEYNVNRVAGGYIDLKNGFRISNGDGMIDASTEMADVYIDAATLDLDIDGRGITPLYSAAITLDSTDDTESDDEPPISHANIKLETEKERSHRTSSYEENEQNNEVDSCYGNGKSYVVHKSNNASSDEDESNYVYMDSPAEDDSDYDVENVKIETNTNDDQDYQVNDDDVNSDDVASVDESYISTEEIDVKAEIDAMIESDLALEQLDTSKIGEFNEVFLEAIDFDIVESEPGDSIGRRTSVDSPASFSTISSRRARTLDVPEFLNTGSYRADFDVDAFPPRPESPPNVVNEQLELQICDFCAAMFISRKMLLDHLYGIHRQKWAQQRVQCGKCNKWLNDRSELKKHLEEHPTEAHNCPHCKKISPTANALKCHIRSVHAERSHKCTFCDKTFRNVTALKGHEATHKHERSFKCTYCGDEFMWRSNMYAHQKKMHPDQWTLDQHRKRREQN